jgi:hypothetical protein
MTTTLLSFFVDSLFLEEGQEGEQLGAGVWVQACGRMKNPSSSCTIGQGQNDNNNEEDTL